MREPHLGVVLVVTMVAIGVIHQLALIHFWYWSVWWTDVALHLLGGFAIGLFVLWIRGIFLAERTNASTRHTLLFVVVTVVLIGIAWEAFEYYAGLFMAERFFPDTLYDLLSDIAGGLIAYVYYLLTRRETLHHEKNE